MARVSDFPLKIRKKARVKLALAEAMIRRIDDCPFDEIKVETLCKDADISRATFFRLFPRKIDLVFFAINLWIIEIGWKLNQLESEVTGYQKLAALFQLAAKAFEEHSHFFVQVVSLRALNPVAFNRDDNPHEGVDPVERLMHYPDYEGIEMVPEGGIKILFKDILTVSLENGELPPETDREQALLSLACIFYGVPIMLSERTSSSLATSYSDQLTIVWQGLGGNI